MSTEYSKPIVCLLQSGEQATPSAANRRRGNFGSEPPKHRLAPARYNIPYAAHGPLFPAPAASGSRRPWSPAAGTRQVRMKHG